MTRLFTTTAAALAFATGAIAQDDPSNSSGGQGGDTPFAQVQPDPTTDIYGSNLIGSQIYGTDQQAPQTVTEDVLGNWDQLGEVSDVMLTPDGQIEYAILGIGGFLGIGERNVAVDMNQVEVVRNEQDPETYYLVINATQDQIENAPEFQRPENSSGGSSSN